jgi:hypothetical protein
MILRQYLHTDPVIAASYLFGCGGQAAGAVVDPVGEPERYLEAAAAVGLRLRDRTRGPEPWLASSAASTAPSRSRTRRPSHD